MLRVARGTIKLPSPLQFDPSLQGTFGQWNWGNLGICFECQAVRGHLLRDFPRARGHSPPVRFRAHLYRVNGAIKLEWRRRLVIFALINAQLCVSVSDVRLPHD